MTYIAPELECAAELGAALRKLRATLDDDGVRRVVEWLFGRYGISVPIVDIGPYKAPPIALSIQVVSKAPAPLPPATLPTTTPTLIKDRGVECPVCHKNGFAHRRAMGGHFYHAHGQKLLDYEAQQAAAE